MIGQKLIINQEDVWINPKLKENLASELKLNLKRGLKNNRLVY